MSIIPPELFKQIQQEMCRPEGAVVIEGPSGDLFDRNKPFIQDIPSGGHIFRFEKSDDLILSYFHSSPGTGTRKAVIDLKELPAAANIFILFSWSPADIIIHIGSKEKDDRLITSTRIPSKKQFRIGSNGAVYQIGDDSIETISASIYEDGIVVIQATAIQAWKETLSAIELLATGKLDKGDLYEYEKVLTNLTIVILVSGFEAYMKRRFLELELEGIKVNTSGLIDAFFTKPEREKGLPDIYNAEAKEQGKTFAQYIVEGKNKIIFQNYEACKKAYNKGYNIKFGEVNLPDGTLEKLQKFIKYRHKIIHISASLPMLEVPPEKPVFPKEALAQEARFIFNQFIDKVHHATLNIRLGEPAVMQHF